jgi:CHAD domain-containing protein
LPEVRQEFTAHRTRRGGPDLPRPPAGFAWAPPGRPRRLRRVWLDTFDWRLYRAGLTLEQVTAGGTSEITLTGRDGTVLAAERTGRGGHPGRPRLTWPARLDALPPGPLREQLAPVAGVRALFPVAKAVSLVHEQPAVNSDDKTVARLTVDRMSVSHPAAAEPPDRIAIAAVRGYQPQVSRLAGALAAAPGVTAATQSQLEGALAAAGGRPGAYTSKIDVELAPRMPAGAALVQVLAQLTGTLTANVEGTVHDVDIEFLHDLRIAVRRIRSVLKLTGPGLPAGLAGTYRPEFKWLGDLTTPTRDLDVFVQQYPALAEGLVAAPAAELAPFGDHLGRQRAAAHRQLARGLRSARFTKLLAGWRSALAVPVTDRKPPVGRLAARRIGQAHQRVLRGGGLIIAASPPEALHDLRKRCKELRYLLEIFGSLYDPAEHWRAVRELKGLQDCLGEFQDTQVEYEELRRFAGEMAARPGPGLAPALLAMGEIAAGLSARQLQARGEFGGRFREFASPAGLSRIQVLTEAVAPLKAAQPKEAQR